jgi:predicted KAP-like P-loop ATPase
MRLFPKELEIAPGEGFTAENDIFGRAAFGQQLTSIVSRVDAPLVLVLDAPWGERKTTFMRMWAGELNKQNIPSIYFDAFANDYQDNAFIALSSHIIDELDVAAPSSAKSKKFRSTAFKVAKVLGKAGLQAGVKFMSAGLIEAEALKGTASEIVGAIRDEAEKSLDEILKDRLESHRSDKEAFAEFRKSLSELCEVLQIAPAKEAVTIDSDNQKNEQELQQRKMVLIIDELDRCRPSFALSILEHIKHFFSVDGVYFILVTSLNQLHSSVKFAYGDIDARSYLEKFYHIRVQFPTYDIARPDLRIITFSRFIG